MTHINRRARTNPLHALFDRLDQWRRFPAYQLERRADIFFSPYLTEVLETDSASRRGKQDQYLIAAKDRGMKSIMGELRDIVTHSKGSARRKYFHLLQALEDLRLLTLPSGLEACVYAQNARGLTALLRQIVIAPNQPQLDKAVDTHWRAASSRSGNVLTWRSTSAGAETCAGRTASLFVCCCRAPGLVT